MKKFVEPAALGIRLKQLRETAGFSKAHVARECGVSDVSAGYWENGCIQEIGHNKLLALAKLYGMTVSELLGDKPSHWTDAHVLFDPEDSKYVAYDEAGLEHGRFKTRDGARDALTVYAATALAEHPEPETDHALES